MDKVGLQIRATGDGTSGSPMTFLGATDNLVRDGDIIEQNWDLRAFRKNPVFLWAHRFGELPIGRVARVAKVRGTRTMQGPADGLEFDVLFVPEDLSPFAEQVRSFYAAGWIRAVSIGWRTLKARFPDESERETKGLGPFSMIHEKNELLELSGAAVGVDPDALKRSAGDKLSAEDARRFFEPRRDYVMQGLDFAGVRSFFEEDFDCEIDPELLAAEGEATAEEERSIETIEIGARVVEKLSEAVTVLGRLVDLRVQEPDDDGGEEGGGEEPEPDDGDAGEETPQDPEETDSNDESDVEEEIDESAIEEALASVESEIESVGVSTDA